MSLIELEWDSNFFGLKIGRIELQDLDATGIDHEIGKARKLGFALLYLFGPARVPLLPAWLEENRCRLVDTKVTYAKSRLMRKQAHNSTLLHAPADIEQLYELAYESGKCSRFRLDPRFGLENFKRLYRAWVDNSVSRRIADDIFVYQAGNSLCGFCTVKYSNDKATIGLIAVSPNHQGTGIGRDLCDAAEAQAVQRGCHAIVVATQQANVGACRFYEKLGMNLAESTDIYHLWLNANDPL